MIIVKFILKMLITNTDRIINISKHTSILKFFYLNVQNECLYAVNHIFLCALNTLNAFERFKISS